METKIFVATKAFINYKNKILILRESPKYEVGTLFDKYDVVGGRVKEGERFDKSLLREIKEETGLLVEIGRPFYVAEWRPIIRDEQWQIVGTFFECFSNSDKVKLSEDHDDYQWIDYKDYLSYNLIDNLKPAFENYLEIKNEKQGI